MNQTRNLISVLDLTRNEIEALYALAAKVKKNPEKFSERMKGKSLALIFQKPSIRTRVSFAVGFARLGGYPVYLGTDDIKLGVREEVKDIARTLARYLDAVVLRTLSHETILEFARYFPRVLINGLSDREHPCQALSDFFTLSETFGSLKKLKISFVGDGNNVCHSLLLLAARLGVDFSVASPKGCEVDPGIMKLALDESKKSKSRVGCFENPADAVRDADVVYTDVWVSMGEEAKASAKKTKFEGFQVNQALLRQAKPAARIMHCLPAHRGEEISAEVFEDKNSIIFDQAENRLHVQEAILLHLLG